MHHNSLWSHIWVENIKELYTFRVVIQFVDERECNYQKHVFFHVTNYFLFIMQYLQFSYMFEEKTLLEKLWTSLLTSMFSVA